MYFKHYEFISPVSPVSLISENKILILSVTLKLCSIFLYHMEGEFEGPTGNFKHWNSPLRMILSRVLMIFHLLVIQKMLDLKMYF